MYVPPTIGVQTYVFLLWIIICEVIEGLRLRNSDFQTEADIGQYGVEDPMYVF